MLFNSYEFIFFFLPIALIVFFAVARAGHEIAIAWLVIASLFFYGWWNPAYLILILLSMLVNFGVGELLGRWSSEHSDNRKGKLYLIIGIVFNLGLLGYFKYAGFFVANLNGIADTDFNLGTIVLPLAISFFTFQQIAYLVDAYKGITQEYRFSHYALFVTFFPQLIAGPIVHHKEMLPQFMRRDTLTPQLGNIAVGLSIFSIGLFKKAVLADGIAPYSTSVFNAAAAGESISFFQAWGGSLSYTMQLYFDFSGYSDMAIGAARLFGIRLPLNFHSPYKATSIIEFWRRWHMTLSRFLRDYLYIPLGGNRKGASRRYVNLMITMLLGGLWHGAGWNFVAWGALHGLYLVINHGWHRVAGLLPFAGRNYFGLGKLLAWLITFLGVVIGWVFFRATDFTSALAMLEGMFGFNGISLPNAVGVRLGGIGEWLQSIGVDFHLGGGSQFVFTYLWITALLVIALVLPNTQELMSRFNPALRVYESRGKHEILFAKRLLSRFTWQPSASWSLTIGLLAAFGVLALTSISEFLYFQF
jgi:D-alanyl-lipoteichoic acid acyltransferase DltB (MBOAT superfamily)